MSLQQYSIDDLQSRCARVFVNELLCDVDQRVRDAVCKLLPKYVVFDTNKIRNMNMQIHQSYV